MFPPPDPPHTETSGRAFIGRACVVIGGGHLLLFVLAAVGGTVLIISAIHTVESGRGADAGNGAFMILFVLGYFYLLLSSVAFSGVGFAILGNWPLSQDAATTFRRHTRVFLGLTGALSVSGVLLLLSEFWIFAPYALLLNVTGGFAGAVSLLLIGLSRKGLVLVLLVTSLALYLAFGP